METNTSLNMYIQVVYDTEYPTFLIIYPSGYKCFNAYFQVKVMNNSEGNE